MKLSRSGYTFLGWAEISTGKVIFKDGETIEIWNKLYLSDYSNTSKIKLYAIWEVNALTVTFNPNGGTITTTEQGINDNQATTLKSAKFLGLSRLGYTFLGWAESPNATEAAYKDAADISFSKSTTLYAVWKENPRHTISFNANGGTIKTENQSITELVPTPLMSADALEISRTGYIFAGWGKNPDDTTVTYNDGQEITLNANSSDFTFYALWAQEKTYEIYFDKNGGSFTDSATATMKSTIAKGTTITGELSINLLTMANLKLTRSGYAFNGWATDLTSNKVVYADGEKITVSSDIHLYAVWEETRTYTITYDANGGYIRNSNIQATQTIQGRISGEQVSLYTKIGLNLNRDKYLFEGWATTPNTSSIEFKNGATITVTGNITLYAVWYLPTYTIAYQSVNTRTSKYVEGYGSYLTLPTASSLGLSNGDAIFLGWSTSGFAKTASYKPGDTIEITSNKTLYAVWQANCIYVKLYHPGYSLSSEKYHTIAFSIGSSNAKMYLVGNPRYSSYTTSYETFFFSGSMAWATSFVHTKGSSTTSVQKSGYNNFVPGGYYQINIVTGTVTKVK